MDRAHSRSDAIAAKAVMRCKVCSARFFLSFFFCLSCDACVGLSMEKKLSSIDLTPVLTDEFNGGLQSRD
jgi:hypothetical protein